MEFKLPNILLHLAIYLTVLIVLKFLYIDPVLRLLRRRDSMTTGRLEVSGEKKNETDRMTLEYSSKLSTLKETLETKRAGLLSGVRKDAEKKIGSAKKDADKKLQELSQQLEQDLEKLEFKLPTLAQDLAGEIERAVLESRAAAHDF